MSLFLNIYMIVDNIPNVVKSSSFDNKSIKEPVTIHPFLIGFRVILNWELDKEILGKSS